MSTVHPLLHASNEGTKAAAKALRRLVTEADANPPSFLSTIAINLWSPYLASGRHTVLEYPKSSNGKCLTDGPRSKEHLERVHHRYMTLLGRNLSANHLMVEVQNVESIVVDGTATRIDGPTISASIAEPGASTLLLSLPLGAPASDACFIKLVPPDHYARWLEWLEDESYERRYKGRLREELLECRLEARQELPEAFASHLVTWVRQNWVPRRVGFGNFDDRWLARIQLTALASKIWGQVWVSRTLSFGEAVQKRLGMHASCTVTGHAVGTDPDAVARFRDEIQTHTIQWSTRLQNLVQEEFQAVAMEVEALDHEPWDLETSTVANVFAADLGGKLIGADHEGAPITLRGLLTQGLDALPLDPTYVAVLHEIDPTEFEPTAEHIPHWSDLWKAYFRSNDLFLARDRVALHFELKLSDDGTALFPVPRHIVQVGESLEEILRRAGNPPAGLMHLGFSTDKSMALHIRAVRGTDEPIVEARVQTNGSKFTWLDGAAGEPDWGAVRAALVEAVHVVRSTLKTSDFFKDSASSLRALSDGQVVQMADGVTEVCRLGRGCLVFVGPVYHAEEPDGGYWFVTPMDPAHRIEVTRLGLAFGVVSQIPDTFSPDFRLHFADGAAMDGETIVFAAENDGAAPAGFTVDRPPGTVITRRFVQLPTGTPALIDGQKPRISPAYADAWQNASSMIKGGWVGDKDGVYCRAISVLKASELLSLGTRHRKASMTTMCNPSIVAITCSASRKIRLWVRGVPIVELEPQSARLLPDLPRPPRTEDA